MEVVPTLEDYERFEQTVRLFVWSHYLALLFRLPLTGDSRHLLEDLRDQGLLVLRALLRYQGLVLLLDFTNVSVEHVHR